MRIAVTSRDFHNVTGHAGHAREFLIFEAQHGREPVEIERLLLPGELVIHEFRGGSHPIDGVDVLLSAGFGAGFARHMAARGITAVRTEKSDPVDAVKHFLACREAGLDLSSVPSCACGHDHDHAHGNSHAHDHDHDHGHDCGCTNK